MAHDDQQARQLALSKQQSFIVKAPAGSGKTELLTQRFLTLLATVEAPEQIVALTFTRKAAAEMRQRILTQLTRAQQNLAEQAPAHQRHTWELARAVLAHDQDKGWRLLQCPERLRLLTIDALCAELVRQLPVANAWLPGPLTDRPQRLYADTVAELLADLDVATPWQAALHTLLQHCDNRLDHLSGLCQQLLRQREQWLPLMIASQQDPVQLKALLEANFQAIMDQAIATLERLMPDDVRQEVLQYVPEAARLATKFSQASACLRDLHHWPSAQDHEVWQALARFFLTEQGQWRKRLDSSLGFPPPSKAPDKTTQQLWQQHKEGMQALLQRLSDNAELLAAWQTLSMAPPPRFEEQEWPLCRAIFSLLPALLVYWQLQCQKHQQVDFAEVSWQARQALGDSEQPSDLVLQWDYQVRHWLVDEFQDTSLAQYDLLTRLTAGWQPGDGRTVFLVGDPLQSIYRFRQAEVSLFWLVWHQGLPSVPVTPVVLTRNFRSQPGLVAWFNHTLPARFPDQANWQVGAVPYTPLISHQAPDEEAQAVMEWSGLPEEEADTLVQCLKQELANPALRSMAILVQARSHLQQILPALHQAKIPYRAVELSALMEQPVVMDLLHLLRALLQRDDRLAWAAVLRAPWGGNLSLTDWQSLIDSAHETFLWPWSERLSALSAAGRQQLARITPILASALQQRHRRPLHHWLAETWLALGGEAYWHQAQAAQDKFWHVLIEHQHVGDIQLPLFEQALATTYLDENQAAVLEIMTIHKAKGLEFEVVFLPGQGRRGQSDEAPLFVFDTLCDPAGTRWLLAPLKIRQQEPRYDFLRWLQKQKRFHEQQRLFYVACTRARQRLYVFKHASAS